MKIWPKNVTSRVFRCLHYIHIEKNAPPSGGHVFSPIWTIFELVRDINKTNVLPNFHDDWAKIMTSRVFTTENCHYIHSAKNAPPTGGHISIKTNVLTNFHDDWAKMLTSRVFIRNTSAGGHVFQRTGTIFELNQHIIKTNNLTKLHEYWASNFLTKHDPVFKLSRCFNETNVPTKFHEDRTINVLHKAKC
ncbi:hypothetical protein DPMN_137963 [Dreissena polymorpha]|uniref:Uncharacterized protein n=1 Tax=Dreissena polymorpha TaxID=45954 RepID=A0A9D4G2V6_DREPO|nr:hypothetical protein DPMN_137963 [Dreissena polymorpha]